MWISSIIILRTINRLVLREVWPNRNRPQPKRIMSRIKRMTIIKSLLLPDLTPREMAFSIFKISLREKTQLVRRAILWWLQVLPTMIARTLLTIHSIENWMLSRLIIQSRNFLRTINRSKVLPKNKESPLLSKLWLELSFCSRLPFSFWSSKSAIWILLSRHKH